MPSITSSHKEAFILRMASLARRGVHNKFAYHGIVIRRHEIILIQRRVKSDLRPARYMQRVILPALGIKFL